MELTAVTLSGSKMIGAGMATIGPVGAGIGVGVALGSSLISLSRNPEYEKQLFSYTILGFALTEAVGSLALMMSFLILFI